MRKLMVIKDSVLLGYLKSFLFLNLQKSNCAFSYQSFMKDAWGIVKSQAWQNEHWETEEKTRIEVGAAATHYYAAFLNRKLSFTSFYESSL